MGYVFLAMHAFRLWRGSKKPDSIIVVVLVQAVNGAATALKGGRTLPKARWSCPPSPGKTGCPPRRGKILAHTSREA